MTGKSEERYAEALNESAAERWVQSVKESDANWYDSEEELYEAAWKWLSASGQTPDGELEAE